MPTLSPAVLSITDLLEYTDWERQKWFQWLQQHGATALDLSAGPHGDGRFQKTGDLVTHIFSAEKRYIQRLSGLPLTDPASIPAYNIEVLFRFGQQSRQELRNFIETFPPERWDSTVEFKLFNSFMSATPRKIVTHILLHEIRHWAQIATIFRLNGLTDDFHDFLFSPVMGGEFRREA